MEDFDVNQDNSIQFDELVMVLVSYFVTNPVTWKNPNARPGCSKCFRSSTRTETA